MAAASLPPACLLAGGRGTRLGLITDELPKPMVEVAGRPFIEWPLAQLRVFGFDRVVICTGYRGDVLRRHLGDGAQFGIKVDYSDDGPEPLGTFGAIAAALPLLGEQVPVLYADTVLSVDFARVTCEHARLDDAMTMTVIEDFGRWGAANCVVEGQRVTAYRKDPAPPGAAWLDYGFSVIDRDAITAGDSGEPADLAGFVGSLAAAGRVRAWPVTEPFHEIGTPESLAATEAFLRAQMMPE